MIFLKFFQGTTSGYVEISNTILNFKSSNHTTHQIIYNYLLTKKYVSLVLFHLIDDLTNVIIKTVYSIKIYIMTDQIIHSQILRTKKGDTEILFN
jgi:hypothetical protein